MFQQSIGMRHRTHHHLNRLLYALLFTLALLPLGRAVQASPATAPVLESSATVSVTLTAIADAYVISSQPTTNYGAGPLGVIPSTRAYALFDLSGLPAAATIDSATLRLMPADIVGAGPWTVNVNRVDGVWDEATVTWNSRPPLVATGANAVVADYTPVDWDVTATVQQWHSGAAVNNGFGLTTGDPGVYFDGKESGYAPRLFITLSNNDNPDDPSHPGQRPHPDLGDAPDSTNHYGLVNTAYITPTVNGQFPTVWQDPTGAPSGPLHKNEQGEGWLGLYASAEREADQGADQDVTNNIINTPAGPLNVSNLDRGDDGWLNRDATFANCEPTTLVVRVSKAAAATLDRLYLNVWFDGNRDGDWADVAQCQPTEESAALRAHEWIVQNFGVNLAAIPAGGYQDITINTLAVMNQTPDRPHWLRFTLSERRAVRPALGVPADGRGPQYPNAYNFGETEDYFQRPAPQGEPGKLTLTKSVPETFAPLRPGDIISYTVTLEHVGGSAPATTLISDTLPAGVHLAGRPRLVVESPRVSPALVHYNRTAFGWRGQISPGGKLSIIAPVRVEACFGAARTITNVAHALQTDGSHLRAEASFGVECPQLSLDDLAIKRYLAYAEGAVNVDTPASVQSSSVAATAVDAYVPGTHTFIRNELTNQGAEPLAIALNLEKIEWSLVASDPDNGDSRAAATIGAGEPTTATMAADHLIHLVLQPGETKSIDTPITAPDPLTDSAPDQDLAGSSALIYCLSRANDLTCPDRDHLRRLLFHFRVRRSDLGDAPDSTNHFGAAMTAYPGVPAGFPTVHDAATGAPAGPLHWNAWPLHLGRGVSFELEADLGPDQDFMNNLRPPANVANRDRFDDGIRPDLINFAHCQSTRIPVQVFITPAMKAFMLAGDHKAYINIWVDSNRNGHGGDSYNCPATDTTPAARALEHIVINFPVDPALLTAGVNNVIVPTRLVAWPTALQDQPAWLRVTLTAGPIDLPLVDGDEHFSDGRGNRYRFGETEDYLLRPQTEPNGADIAMHKTGRVRQDFDPAANTVVSKVAWAIDYHNVGDQPAREVVLRDLLDKDVDLNAVLLDVRTAPAVPYAVEGKTLVFRVGEVAPGAGGKIAIIMATRQLTLTGNVITNTVRAVAANDGNSDNNEASARVEIGLRAPRIVTPIDGSTCQNEVIVRGLAQAGAAVDLYVDGALAATVTADSQGRWQQAQTLADGLHEIYAIARVGGASSVASATVKLKVDSTLLWNPMSLAFTDDHGRVRRPHDDAGRLDAEGWRLNLRPNTTYTVSVEICCSDGNGQVTLALDDTDASIELTDEDNDGVYTATFTTGPRNPAATGMTLTVVCGDQEVTASGDVVLIDPEGVVFDVLNGNLLTDATVACMEATTSSAAADDANTIFALWDADAYGQVNPQQTLADGYFSFLTPAGTYQLTVSKAGYQPHRSPELAVVNDPVRYDVPLTPVIAEDATAQVSISDLGFEPAVLTVEPGAIIAWTNVDVNDHTASSENSTAAATAGSRNTNGILLDSGLLGAGESYKFRLETEGTYTVFDRTNPANTATIIVSQSTPQEPLDNLIYLPLVHQ